jgi:hypothetical protein
MIRLCTWLLALDIAIAALVLAAAPQMIERPWRVLECRQDAMSPTRTSVTDREGTARQARMAAICMRWLTVETRAARSLLRECLSEASNAHAKRKVRLQTHCLKLARTVGV